MAIAPTTPPTTPPTIAPTSTEDLLRGSEHSHQRTRVPCAPAAGVTASARPIGTRRITTSSRRPGG